MEQERRRTSARAKNEREKKGRVESTYRAGDSSRGGETGPVPGSSAASGSTTDIWKNKAKGKGGQKRKRGRERWTRFDRGRETRRRLEAGKENLQNVDLLSLGSNCNLVSRGEVDVLDDDAGR